VATTARPPFHTYRIRGRGVEGGEDDDPSDGSQVAEGGDDAVGNHTGGGREGKECRPMRIMPDASPDPHTRLRERG
jgi:hypothetical protein